MVANEEIITTSIVFILKALKTFVFVILLFPFLYFVAVIISRHPEILGKSKMKKEESEKIDDKRENNLMGEIKKRSENKKVGDKSSSKNLVLLFISAIVINFMVMVYVPLVLSSKTLTGLLFAIIGLLVCYLPFAFYLVSYCIELFEE